MADATIRVDADTRGAERALGRVTAALGALASAVAVKAIVQQYTAFERYRTVLNTYLGSQAKANLELNRLQKLANSLPQDLDDITRSFTLFTSRGLDTSTKALTAFSNIATANGKSLTQLGEAIADALTGEYERLKEFGIKVSKDNDQFVADIGAGQKIIANSSRELVQQLQALGEEGGKFGKAAENNAKTLSQSFSNLRGAVFETSVAFGEGANTGLKSFTETLTEVFRENAKVAESLGRVVGNAARVLGNAIKFAADNLEVLLQLFGSYLALQVARTIGSAATAFGFLGSKIKLSGAALDAFRAKMIKNVIGAVAALSFFIANQMGVFDELYKKMGLISETPFLDDLIEQANNLSVKIAELKDASPEWLQTLADARPVMKQLKAMREELETNISAHKVLIRDQDVESDNYKDLTRDLNELEAKYKRVTEALDMYAEASAVVIEVTDERTDAEIAAAKVLAGIDKRINQIEQTKFAIQGVTDAYAQGAIEANEFFLAMDELTKAQLQASADLIDARRYEMRQIMDRYDLEQRLIAENERFRQIQIEKSLKKQGASDATARQIAQDRVEFEKKNEFEKAQFAIEQGASVFNELGKANKKAFEAAKAFNIANAIMNTYSGATKALATYPPPFNFIAAAAVVAAGLAQVASIRSQQYSGRALGGPVMAGQSYIVGENGPEMFTPATSGGITRNQDLQPSNTNINFYIQTNDAKGFDQLLAERKPMIVNMIRTAQEDRGSRSKL